MGKIFISQFTEIKFEIWRVTFFTSFLPLKNYRMGLNGNNGNIECH